MGRQVSDLERRRSMIDPQQFGALQATVERLEKDVHDLAADVKQLLELANKGKGAAWLGLSVSGVLGGFAVWIAERFLR
jgi:hypothetical protein